MLSSTQGANYRATFEAKVQADLQALGLAENLSAQATAPKAYLNVLKLSDSSARAYFKTTFPSTTTCTLNWGDGSVAGVTTPTPAGVSIQTADHSYSASGTYSITLTCGASVQTMSFSAVVPVAANVTFEDYGQGDGNPPLVDRGNINGLTNIWTGVPGPLNYQNLTFTGTLFMVKGSYYSVPNHIALMLCSGGQFSLTNGATFAVKSINGASYLGQPGVLTAYDASNNVIGTTTFNNDTEGTQAPYETHLLNWQGVAKVKMSGSAMCVGIDDMSITPVLPKL
ncbi:hypothetical protein D3875_04265 [Deinococcus cavernae]|uniref:PKD domain-containing protein n=1 Tax=Deinococcus cavernae TaxID=2320857 RepID=A0A418VEH3_9DEIO|nr:hypothetical protein D3875_04265 [Deinococcus cavernae]